MRIIAGFSAGRIVDLMARLMGQWLSEQLGQQFVVENRTGAAGNLATESVAKSPPDGYTLLMINSPNATNAPLYQNLKFNFITDIAPVASLYRNAPSEHIRAGRLRALGVTTAMRSPELPDVAAVGEFVPGYEASGSQGIGAPRNTPAEVIDMLNKDINAGLADAKMKMHFADAGGYAPWVSSPAEFRNSLRPMSRSGPRWFRRPISRCSSARSPTPKRCLWGA